MGKLECSVVDSTTDSKFLLYNSKMNFNFFRSRHYSSHWKMTLTGSFYVLALILDVVSSAATIHTSQTSFIEGSKVVLVCKASTSDMTRWVFNSSNTLSQDCFIRDPVKKIVCDKENGWFNLTIDSIQRTDDGTYQCLNGEGDSVTVDVLVPMKADVELKVIKERTLPNDTKPISGFVDLRPNSSNDTEVIMECTTDCAYKAPIISWYGAYTGPQQQTENNKLDEKTYHTKEESCDGPLGLLRSVSRLTIAAEDKKSSVEAQQNITCSARQDFTQYGGVDLIKRGQIRVLFGGGATVVTPIAVATTTSPGTKLEKPTPAPVVVPGEKSPSFVDLGNIQRLWLRSRFSVQSSRMGGLQAQPLSTLEIAGIAVGAGVILLLVLLGVACFMWSRTREQNACEDEDVKEKINTNDERV